MCLFGAYVIDIKIMMVYLDIAMCHCLEFIRICITDMSKYQYRSLKATS